MWKHWARFLSCVPMLYVSFLHPFIHRWTFELPRTKGDLGVQISPRIRTAESKGSSKFCFAALLK